jgi:prevent-host-death family protein
MFSDDQEVVEVGAKELARGVARVLDQVAKGARVIVTRNGRPVAVICSMRGGVELMLAGSERFVALRREAFEELESGVAETLETWRSRWP